MNFLIFISIVGVAFCENNVDVKHEESFWVYRLFLNLLGYASVIIPGYFIINFLKRSEYLNRKSDSFVHACLQRLVLGSAANADDSPASIAKEAESKTDVQSRFPTSVRLLWCVFGLLTSYLLWGYLQERIMTQQYDGEMFRNSLFLVFMNRILALFIGCLYLYLKPASQPNGAPFYMYSYSSFSNTLSSWCQYEALKFVSFPVQVLAKASKIIPVMLMGKFLNGKSYRAYEYITAALISLGVGVFMLASKEPNSKVVQSTTISGGILLVMYLTTDAFTSNWQSGLFSKHKMSSIQMMVGVNVFSVMFTGFSLLEQGGLVPAFHFMQRHVGFTADVVALSVCSTTGQLFIFHTIAEFGAVTFTIIMTTRQALAILISCIVFLHPITALGLLGILLVFAAVATRVYCQHRVRQQKLSVSSLSANPANKV